MQDPTYIDSPVRTLDGPEYIEVDGEARELPKQETVMRATPKVGRNDPCPCGSGKKYKNCCGRTA